MKNASSGTSADIRVLLSDDLRNSYLGILMPSTGNTGALFGQTRSNIAAIATNTGTGGGGSGRILALGTINNNDVLIGTSNLERIRVSASGNVGIGTTTPANTLDVAGTVKLGSAGTALTAMGVCTVASYTPTSTAANKTCTGVPASSSVAVQCSPSAAFQTPNTTVINARATGTVNQIAVNLSAANNVAVTLTCMWVQP